MTAKKRKINFYRISWTMYQAVAKRVGHELNEFCEKNHINIDCIVPILRGGGVLAVSLAHSLNIHQMYPVQYKYDYFNGAYLPRLLLDSIKLIENKDVPLTILVTEGNHCTGQTAQTCINLIHNTLKSAQVIYVSIGRDYSFRQALNGTIYEFAGIYTNESETLTQIQCDELGIRNKFTVYPWESIQEEMDEVNSSMQYHNPNSEGER